VLDMVWYYLAFCVWYYNRANLCVVNSNEVTGVNGITCCAPSLADDITCIRTTPRGLPRMFDIYTEYANKWMFDIYTEYANKWMFDIYRVCQQVDV
jgi:hypothetical protein